ncbi:MAG: DNA polymerase [Sulfolobales archaeon]
MRPHYIKPNKAVRLPQSILFYDTETYEEKVGNKTIHRLRLGVARYVRLNKAHVERSKYYIFRTPTEFWDIVENLTRKKTRLWIISHNQHFDFNIVNGFEELVSRGWRIRKMVIESDIFAIKFTKDSRTILVVDSTNYFKAPLSELGKQIGLPKLEVNFKTASDDELIKYCKRDVEILSEYFINFLWWWVKNNLGNFTVSIAGLAFNAFKHRFMKAKILIHNNEDALKLELDSYRGGRNECFYVGEVNTKVYKLDVNSMYPFVMRYNPYPTKLKKVVCDLTPEQLNLLLKRYQAICDVCINTNEPAYGVKKHKLIFPVGRFRVTLTTPELTYALENDHLEKVYKCSLYEYGYIFKDYVDFFYNIKKEAEEKGQKVIRNFAKLMLNSLYGKFAQRVTEFEEIDYYPIMKFGSTFIYDMNTKEKSKVYFILGKAFKVSKERKLFYDAFIAIASHVSAYARMYLWHLIKTAGRKNVYYVDTDSLFVNDVGYDNLKHFIGNELGLLKLEGEADHAIFMSPKDYVFGNEVKLKGIKPDSIMVSNNTFIVPTWLRTKSLLSKGFTAQVIIEDRIKTLRREYDKGEVGEDGWVKPYVLDDCCG